MNQLSNTIARTAAGAITPRPSFLGAEYVARLATDPAHRARHVARLETDPDFKARIDHEFYEERKAVGHCAYNRPHRSVPLDLSTVDSLIARAAASVRRILDDNSDTRRHGSSPGDFILATYCRHLNLFEDYALQDDVERLIAGAILRSAEGMNTFLTPATDRGLALLDMHLVESARHIKLMLATQSAMTLR